MANFILSPNMNLPIPSSGLDPGPDYALNVNNGLTIIDGHDHTSGSGVQITPAAININSDLTFQNNNLTNARTLRLSPQPSTPSASTDVGAIFESSAGDMWYINSGGTPVQITNGNSISGTNGAIANLAPPASATYVSADATFVWKSTASLAANMDAGFFIMRNTTPNSTFGLTFQPPAGMSANYTITLPTAAAIGGVSGTNGYIYTDSGGDLGVQTADQLAFNMTRSGSDQIGSVMGSAGANAIAAAMTKSVSSGSVGIGGVLSSLASGSFSTTSTTDQGITNCSGNITTSGRPVFISLIPQAAGSPASIGAPADSVISLYRDSSRIFQYEMSNGSFPASLVAIDNISAGTHNYSWTARVVSSGTVFVLNCVLIAYEL